MVYYILGLVLMVWWAVFSLVNYWKEILQYPEAETPVNWPGTAGRDAAGSQLFPLCHF
jgi:hypothetical protein